MREASTVSPFAALSSREQKEKWICWQCQRENKYGKPTVDDERSVLLPPLKLPELQNNKQTEVYEKQTNSFQKQTIRHAQYDAVINRLKTAQKRAGAYTTWSS